MDVVRARVVLVSVLCLYFLTGCGDLGGEEEKTFPSTSAKCEGTAVPQQYVVHWRDGRTTLHKHTTREELLKNLVRPNLKEIEFAEQDQIVKSIPNDVSQVSSQAVASETW